VPRTLEARDIPPFLARVQDEAGLLSPAVRQRLDGQLLAYQQQTGHQLVVLTLPSLEGEALEDFTIRVMEAWKLGDAQRDDGLLLFVSVAERHLRIEVGHGLEGDLTDAASSRIINDVIRPAFRRGEMEAGIVEGVKAILAATGAPDLPLPAAYQDQRRRRSVGVSPIWLIVFVVLLLLGSGRGGPRRRGWGWGAAPLLFGGRRSGFGGGGFGGGGFGGGGFGGGGGSSPPRGGGGSFGGGGASGSW
jgi:uncharacterized protein